MASKYAHLKGVVPEEPTEREQAITDFMEAFKAEDATSGATAARINKLMEEAKTLAAQVKETKQKIDAAEALMRQRMDSEGAELIRADGYSWSQSCTPYPICEDPEAIVKYFKDNGMEHRLALTNTELAARLKEIVREEAENNELIIDITVDEATGKETRVVRSHVEGVKVFLDTSLSRRKAGSSGRSQA